MFFRHIVFLIFGLIFGSFANVLIYRIPRRLSIVYPPSSCTACNLPIKWYDNIPVLSYIILKGRCRNCGAVISIRYPVIELLSGFLFIFSSIYFRAVDKALLSAAFLYFLLIISVIDLEHKIIPNVLSLPFALLSLSVAFIGEIVEKPVLPLAGKAGVRFALGGMLAFALVSLTLYVIGLIFYRKEGIGMGDIKLGLTLGIFLGFYSPLSLFFAYLLALPFGLYVKKLHKEEYLPLGPFLSAGALIVLIWGPSVVSWYLKSIGE